MLVDLTVLNLFNEYWDFVYIEFFTISLLTAVLLQFLLKVTIAIEHRVAGYFESKTGLGGEGTARPVNLGHTLRLEVGDSRGNQLCLWRKR